MPSRELNKRRPHNTKCGRTEEKLNPTSLASHSSSGFWQINFLQQLFSVSCLVASDNQEKDFFYGAEWRGEERGKSSSGVAG
jgi:hypothetical protein